MSVTYTSRTIQPVEYAGNNPKKYQDGTVMNKYKCVTNFFIQKYTINQKRLQFDAASKTITNINNLDYEDFVQDYDFRPNTTIICPLSVSNNGTLHVTAVSGRVISVSDVLVNETLEVGYIYDNTPINALEYLYNLIGPTEQENYNSKTDNSIQKYIVSGIDASDTVNSHNLLIGTKSFGWVTDAITAPNISTSTIKGAGFSGNTGITTAYQQAFTITHYFYIAPFVTKEQVSNLLGLVAPSIFPLSYICSVNAKIDGSANIHDRGSMLASDGAACWFDQNDSGTVPEYSLGSIAYADVNNNPMTAIDFNKDTYVTVVINSSSGLFAGNTVVKVGHFYVSLNDATYKNTPTTLLQNLFYDIASTANSLGPQNGSNNGTPYQVIEAAQVSVVTANALTIKFKVSYGSTIKNFMKSVDQGNRNYVLAITTEKVGGFGDNPTDRVAILVDFRNCIYDQSDPTLLTLKDAAAYQFPDIGENPKGSIAGAEGDPAYVEYAFNVETNPVNNVEPVLEEIKMQVVAVKANKNDFVVEEKVFPVSNNCRYQNGQVLSILDTRRYNTTDGDIYNETNLFNDEDYDEGTRKGFILQYAFVLRYDAWNGIGTTMIGGANCNQDINNDIQNVNNAWSNLATQGWSLVMRFHAEMKGYDGAISTFEYDMPIKLPQGDFLPDTGNFYGGIVQYFDMNNKQIQGIVVGGQTRVRAVFTSNNQEALPAAFCGSFFADIINSGGPTNRRFANTERPSEAGSPWSDPIEMLYAALTDDDGEGLDTDDGVELVTDDKPDIEYCDGNVRIGIYKATGIIVLESIFDDSIYNWTAKSRNILIYPRLVPVTPTTGLDDDDGEAIATDQGQKIEVD